MPIGTMWDEQLEMPETLEILRGFALRHAKAGGPQGEVIYSLIEAGNYADLLRVKLNPDAFTSDPTGAERYRQCRQALAFFQKLEDLDIGVDKEQAAWEKFQESERRCAETNTFFRQVSSGAVLLLPRDAVILYSAREKIRRILGEKPPALSTLDHRFGPGATTNTKKNVACPQMKLAAGLSCSSRMLHSAYLYEVLRCVPHWTAAFDPQYSVDDDGWLVERVEVTLSDGRLAFVPKTAHEYRSTVTEPPLNGFVQLGIGDWVKNRLRACGIDITDQAINQCLAREGSLTGELATLDLSSASDTIARELVKFLLPPAWYSLLDGCRCETVTYRPRGAKKRLAIRLEKFSTMGNGFTFPLETLIFWSLTRASCAGTVSAYGDDIICPSRAVERVIRTLTVAGFVINESKSFWSARLSDTPSADGSYRPLDESEDGGHYLPGFRESCGCDYFLGFETRPYYQKERISGATLFCLHNYYVRWMDDDGCKAVLAHLPRRMRLWGPEGYGDGHLVRKDYVPDLRRNLPRSAGWSGYYFETYRFGAVKLPPRFAGDYVSPLYQAYVTSDYRENKCNRTSLPPRESVEVDKTQNGFPLWGLPGVSGYERVKIYTFG